MRVFALTFGAADTPSTHFRIHRCDRICPSKELVQWHDGWCSVDATLNV